MKEKILELAPTCKLELCEYETFPATLTLDYTEHSPAHGYSDTFTSVDISQEKAQEIVAFLQGYNSKDSDLQQRLDAAEEALRVAQSETLSTIAGLLDKGQSYGNDEVTVLRNEDRAELLIAAEQLKVAQGEVERLKPHNELLHRRVRTVEAEYSALSGNAIAVGNTRNGLGIEIVQLKGQLTAANSRVERLREAMNSAVEKLSNVPVLAVNEAGAQVLGLAAITVVGIVKEALADDAKEGM